MAHTRAAVLAYPSPEILRIEHSQANPLKLSLAWDPASEMPASLTLRAEIHPSRSVASNAVPLAAVTLVVTDADTQPWALEFSSQQTNLDLGGRDEKPFVLTITGIESSTRLYTLADADLVLLRHPCSQLVPVAVSPLLYATTEDLDAIDARLTVVEETGGGGGGSTNLTMTRTANAVTITPSGGGTAAEIPQATNTHAGVLTAAHHAAIDALGTMSTQSAASVAITGGTITGTTVSGVTLSGSATPTLAVTGTTAVSGSNTGDQTIQLTGDVTGSGTGSFAATIAASAVTYAKMQAVSAASRLLGRGTAGTTAVREVSLGTGLSMSGDVLSATATGGGTNTILQFFPRDAEFPTTNFATIDTRNNHPCLDFDDTTVETVFFTGFIPQGATFAGTGTALTFVLESTAASATGGNIGWNVALERIVAGGIDIDADNFGTAQGGSAAVNTTSGIVTEVSVTFTQAQLPTSLAAGDMIRVRVQRNTSVSGDHVGDAELLGVYANMTPQIA